MQIGLRLFKRAMTKVIMRTKAVFDRSSRILSSTRCINVDVCRSPCVTTPSHTDESRCFLSMPLRKHMVSQSFSPRSWINTRSRDLSIIGTFLLQGGNIPPSRLRLHGILGFHRQHLIPDMIPRSPRRQLRPMTIFDANVPIVIVRESIDGSSFEESLQERDVQFVDISRIGKLEGVVGRHREAVCIFVAGLVLRPVPSSLFYQIHPMIVAGVDARAVAVTIAVDDARSENGFEEKVMLSVEVSRKGYSDDVTRWFGLLGHVRSIAVISG
jgi:hypothetical protein